MKFFQKLNKNKTYKFLQYSLSTFFVLLLLSNVILKVDKIFAFTIENPSILNVQTVKKDGFTNHVYVNGLTSNGTKILIYIDGNYEDIAQITLNNNEELNTFEYYSENPLPKGKHEIKIIAKNETLSKTSSPISRNITVYKTIESYTDTNNTNTAKTGNDATPSTPEIATPQNNQTFERNWVIISGLTSNDTRINIFLNGNFIASTDFLTDNSGTASFNYKIENLQNNNKVCVQSETRSGVLSEKSQDISFSIKKKEDVIIIPSTKTSGETSTEKTNTPQTKNTTLTPTITINTPQNNSVIANKLEISGQTQNTNQIEIFIDSIMVHQIKNKENLSNFKYVHDKNLDNGMHIAHIEVKNGNKIEKSKYINFIIANTNTISDINNQNNDNGTTTKQKATTTQNQNNNSSSKVIFILFLMAIIIWLAIINKEFIAKKIKGKDNNKKTDNGDKINFEKPEETKKENDKNN